MGIILGDFTRIKKTLNNISLLKRGGAVSSKSLPKKALFLCLFLGFALAALSASDILWSWEAQDTKYFRYQLNGEADGLWTVVDGNTTSVQLNTRNGDVLYVQSSLDGINWSESGTNTYIKAPISSELSLRLNLTPYALDIFDFYNGHETSATRATSSTIYGFTTGLEADWTLAKNYRLYLEFSYALGLRPEPVMPAARVIHYLKLGAGFDYHVHITEPDILAFGLFGGAVLSINNKNGSLTPYFGTRIGYERVFSDHLCLSAFTRVGLSFYKTNEPLYDSLTVFVEPVSVAISYKFGGSK